MLKFIKRYLAFIITGSFSFILAACYGAPMEIGRYSTIVASDGDGNPIEGLKVTLTLDGENKNSQYTNIDGVVDLENLFLNDSINYIVKLDDIDGEKNGVFQTKELPLDKGGDARYEINMEK